MLDDVKHGLVRFLDQSTENLRLCLYIIQAYVLLSPQDFFSHRGAVVIETLQTLLGDLRVDSRIMAMRLFETCLRASPQHGAELIMPLLIGIFEYVNIIKNLSTFMSMNCVIEY